MFFYLSGFGFLSCFLLGGSTSNGHLSDAVLQLLSIPVLLAALWRILDAPRLRETRRALAFCGAILAVPLLQLVPLPPALWTHLPGREAVVAAFELLGRRPSWGPISMASNSTWLSALSLLPPLAVFLSLLTLDWPDRRVLSLLAIAAGVASAFLGLAQLAQGPTSPLRFYQVTNEQAPVGFFANQNHLAALLYSAIPLTAAWLAAKLGATRFASGRGRGNVDVVSLMKTIAMSIALLTLITVEVIGRSRAGIILTMVGLLGALALTGEPPRHIKNLASPRVLLGVVALVFLFVGNSALVRILDRFSMDPLSDERVVFARNTVSAAKTFMPIGAGLGAFVPVYPMFTKPRDLVAGEYVNHAHNDLLELWLETGVAGPLLLCLFLYWLVGRAARAWGPSNPGPLAIDKYLIRAAILIIVLLLCHSLVDYPLRTGALMAVMAFACALLIDPALPAVAMKAVATPIDAGRPRGSRSAIERSQGRSPRHDQPRRRDRLP